MDYKRVFIFNPYYVSCHCCWEVVVVLMGNSIEELYLELCDALTKAQQTTNSVLLIQGHEIEVEGLTEQSISDALAPLDDWLKRNINFEKI